MTGRRGRHGLLCLLAAAILLAGCGDDSSGSGRADGAHRWFVPEDLPEDFELCRASEGLMPYGTLGEASPATVWGDASLPDPLAGPTAAAWVEQAEYLPVHDDVRPVTIRGKPGYVGAMQLFQAVSSREWGHIATWMEAPGVVVEVAFRNGTEADLLRVAESVHVQGERVVFPADALGARTEPVATGVALSPLAFGVAADWWLSYRGSDPDTTLEVMGWPADGEALELMRFWAVASERLTVRGHDGLLYAGFDAEQGPWGVIWEEPDGQVVQIGGFTSRTDIVDAVESVISIDRESWKALTARAATC